MRQLKEMHGSHDRAVVKLHFLVGVVDLYLLLSGDLPTFEHSLSFAPADSQVQETQRQVFVDFYSIFVIGGLRGGRVGLQGQAGEKFCDFFAELNYTVKSRA